jgi:hypothetical protein
LKPLWEARPDHEAPLRGPRPQCIMSLAFSSDGKQLATGGYANNVIRIWDVARGTEIRRFKGPGTQIGALAFAPMERTLISGSDDGTVSRWDPDSGEKNWETKQVGEVRTLAFSPDGKGVAVGGGPEYGWRRGKQNEPFLLFLNPTTGQKLRQIPLDRDSVLSIGFQKTEGSLQRGSEDVFVFGTPFRSRSNLLLRGTGTRFLPSLSRKTVTSRQLPVAMALLFCGVCPAARNSVG